MGAIPRHALLLLLCLSGALPFNDPYHDQPKLMTESGHLLIVAGIDKNITLRTSGDGYINLNNENLLHIAQMARRASDTVVQFRRNLETNIQYRLNSLSRQISGPRGITAKIAVLEQAIASGNLSTSSLPGSISPPSSSGLGIRITRLGGRVRSVEIQLRSLRNLLTIDECLSNPCRNGGTCQDLFNGFICLCPTNWQGRLCDEDVNECMMFAGTESGCRNGATCVNKPGTYECVCVDGWFGLHCTLRVNDCTATNSAQLCGHGVCVNQGGTGRGYTCICDEGWTTDLQHSCTVDIDECQAKRYPCSHDPLVQCINLPGTYHCGFCPPGYTGNGFQCSDINECETNNGGCSLVPRVSCLNTRGSRICGHCPPGFTGDGILCTPMSGGACAINNGGCFPSAHCLENAGIVSCVCPNGYAGNGFGPGGCSPSTLAIHPCHSNPCKNGGTCVPSGPRALCICHPQHTGADCSLTLNILCNPNPCQNNGACSVQTVEGVPLARCTCPAGFEGDRCETVSSDCGGMFYQDNGELQVPLENAVQRYENGKLCTWQIEVSSNKVVQVNFTELAFDTSENCEKNFVKILQPTLNSASIFCQNGVRPQLTTLTNVFKVEFFTTTGSQSNHFKLTWKAIEPGCGGEFMAKSHGTIESPQYPRNYPHNQDCEWKLLAPPGKRIQLLFNNVDIEPSTDCSKDYLKIQEYDDDNPTSLLGQFCNSSSPAPITTHKFAAHIFFHSDGSGSARGFRITYTLLDGCGGVLTAASGDISPPMGSQQKYLSEQDCEWRIQLPIGDKIKLVFNSFDLEEREECDDYVELRDGPSATSPLVGQWCGSRLPPPRTSSGNSFTIIFHSDFLIDGAGFTIHYETVCGGVFTSLTGEIKSPNYPLAYSASHECVYLINTPPSTSIKLHFLDFELEHTGQDCRFDYLEIRDGDNANSTLIDRYCGDSTPPDVLSTHNYLYITFNADDSYQYRGFLANYSTIDILCGGILKETVGTFSSPQTEGGYPPGARCKWVISAPPGWAVRLGWLAFHLEYSRDCSLDAVEVYENNTDTGNGTLLDRYCGLKLPPSTVTTTNLVTVAFRSDDSVHREGFTLHYVMIDRRKVCGGTFRSVNGYIESPNYPDNYPDNKECIWIIHVPQGRQIRLMFETFSMESHSNQCNYDSLTIRNGLHETSPLVGKYCGTDLPPDVTSLTNGLWVHFSSDRSTTSQGFRATWDAASTGCGGTLTGQTGMITSPNYPQPYARFAQCFFKISVSQGSKVRLNIVDLDLEPHVRCSLDYVEIFDGLNDHSKSLGRFCSSSHQRSIASSRNQMFIKFVSDISFAGRGFQFQYHTDCNITLKGHYGALESPNYPEKYGPSLNCMWMIQAPKGNKVNISFVHFDLEDSARPFSQPDRKNRDCKYDYLEISEGTQNRTPNNILGRFCGSTISPLIASKLDQVYLHFVTDHMIERSGFRLEWAVSGCGGMFREKPTGSFTSPNYPNGYPESVECEWLIIAPWDKSIEITVKELHLEDLNDCDNDYLAIYAGEDDTAPRLVKACKRQTSPVVVTTSGNHAFIRFESDYSISGKGFSASWKFLDSKCGGRFTMPYGSIHSHNYPNNYENNDDCEWLIEVQPAHLINLTFTDFDVEPSSNDFMTDYVNVYDGNSVNAPLLLNHSGNELPKPAFVISTNNTLLVRHKADGSLTAKGFSAQYSLACGARISAKGTGTFSLGSVVGASHPWDTDYNANCTWYIIAEDPADKILLTFTFLDLSPSTENTEDECSYNYVAVHDGDDTNATLILRQCATKIPTPVRSSGGALTVQAVSLTYGYHLGTFSAMYSTLSTACGGELTSEQGMIASPNYPDGYPANADCEWELKASVGNQVTLSFLKFDLEQSEFCNSDYVEVRSGASNGLLHGVFCGSELPTNVTATANSLWVRFRSDGINTAKGFLAEYSLIHGIALAGDEGQIASPMYPRPFVQQGEYKWTISVSNNKVVKITFSDFYIDKYSAESGECYISLQVFDGPDNTSPSLLQTCGAALPSPVMSTNNIVTVLLNNNPWHHGSLFLLSWQAVSHETEVENTTVENTLGCGKLIHLSPTNDSVTFTTPNFPKPYNGELTCDWIIDTSPGHHLELVFTVFDLEETDECYADYVVIYTESSEDAGWKPLSAQLCLPNTTITRFVAGSKMKIHFESDHSIQEQGFSAKVTSECGGTLTDPNGILDTTLIKTNLDRNKVSCEWTITVRSGRTIQFDFDKFNLPTLKQDSCDNDYLMIRNGGYSDSPPLGQTKYCGNTAPLIPKTSSNRAFISYKAKASTPGLVMKYSEVVFNCRFEIILSHMMPNMTIRSPGYPQPPSTPHITCTWEIIAPPGEAVQMDFVHRFDLKRSPGCTLEYIEVRDGGTELSPLKGKWCSITPPTQVSQGNRMYIKYFTDTDTPNNGFSAVVRIATCGGTFFDQSRMTLYSPNYPRTYPPNLDCTWRIVGVDQSLQLRFNVTELMLADEECEGEEASDYINIIDVNPLFNNASVSNNTKHTRLCGRQSVLNGTSLVPPSRSHEVFVHFHSGPRTAFNTEIRKFAIAITVHRLRCHHEIDAPSGTITSPGYPNPTPRNSYFFCSWTITVPEGRRVSLKMIDYDLEPKKVNFWSDIKLYFYSGNVYITGASPTSVLTHTTINSFGNKMKIYYEDESITGAHRGFKAEFSSDLPEVCGGKLPDSGVVSFNPGAHNYTFYICEWTHFREPSDPAQVTFTLTINGTLNNSKSDATLPSYSTNDAITVLTQSGGDAIYLLQINDEIKSPTVLRIPFFKTTITAKKRAPYKWFGSNVSLPSTANFSLSFKTDTCGGIVNGSGFIMSPGHPSPYSPNLDCAWFVKFPPNTQINVDFISLDLDPDCNNDFLQVYNGGSQLSPHLTTRLCGNTAPHISKTQDNVLFIEFHSGAAKGSHTGFKIQLTQDIIGCGGTIHLKEGSVESPNHGKKDYLNNTECDWTVILPAGFQASLSFTNRFSLENSSGCTNDYIQIFDWRNEKWQQIGQNICGRFPPSIIKTSTNRFRVLFRTNAAVTSDGFKLSWKSLCGGIIDVEGQGTIISPNYPNNYFGDLNCNYTLLAPRRTIYGKFKDIEIERSYDNEKCTLDNVTLTTYAPSPSYFRFLRSSLGIEDSWRFLTSQEATYCGSQLPDPVSSHNKLELWFRTDRTVGYKGFMFTYSLFDCGGNITSPTVISRPTTSHFPRCTWLITAPADKVVVIKFKKFTNFLSSCSASAVSLYNGHNVTNSSSLIEKLCGFYPKERLRYVSSDNKMAVLYFSETYMPMLFEAAISFTYGEKQKCGGTIRTEDVTLPYLLQAPDVDRDGKYEAFLSCDWLFLAPEAHQLRVTINKIDIQNCTRGSNTCDCDYLEIHDGDNDASPQLGRFCGSVADINVVTSSMGSLLIHFSSDGVEQLSGFQLAVTSLSSPCGPIVRNATKELQILQSPVYSGDSNQVCLWQIIPPPRGHGLLLLRFTQLNLPSPCTYNYLSVVGKYSIGDDDYRGRFLSTPMMYRSAGDPVRLCGNRTVEVKHITSNIIQIQYATNRASSTTGFTLQYKMQDCSDNYTAPFGRIVANQRYQTFGEGSCHILIRAPYSNATISLFFNRFLCLENRGYLPEEESRMVVYDGSSDQAEEITSYCAARRPNPVFSSGPSLYLVFKHFRRISRFDITYTSTDQGRGCGGKLSDMSGSFSSPLYPSSYKHDSACRWDVSVPHGFKIYFNFIYFDIGPTSTCNTNYIQFYNVDGASGLESMHSRYCGQEKPAEVEMIGDTAIVRYFTTIHNNGTGWVLEWSVQRDSDIYIL